MVYDNSILIVGGYKKKNCSQNHLLEVIIKANSPAQLKYDQFPRLLNNRVYHSTFAVNNFVFALFGSYKENFRTDIEFFDLQKLADSNSKFKSLEVHSSHNMFKKVMLLISPGSRVIERAGDEEVKFKFYGSDYRSRRSQAPVPNGQRYCTELFEITIIFDH